MTQRLVEQTLQPKVEKKTYQRGWRGGNGKDMVGTTRLKGPQPLAGGKEPRTQRRETDHHIRELCAEKMNPQNI